MWVEEDIKDIKVVRVKDSWHWYPVANTMATECKFLYTSQKSSFVFPWHVLKSHIVALPDQPTPMWSEKQKVALQLHKTSPKLRHHTRQCIAWTLRSGHGRHIWATIKIFYTLKAMSQITRSKPPWCTYMHDFMTEAKPCPQNGSRYFAYFYIKDRGMEIPCHL